MMIQETDVYLEALRAYNETTDDVKRAYYKRIIDKFNKSHKKELNPIARTKKIGKAHKYYA